MAIFSAHSRPLHQLDVEVALPEIELPNLAVHFTPRQLAMSSDVDHDDLQLCQVIDLPCEISMDGVDPEQIGNTIRIVAAVRLRRLH
jgi:hypothetical protein